MQVPVLRPVGKTSAFTGSTVNLTVVGAGLGGVKSSSIVQVSFLFRFIILGSFTSNFRLLNFLVTFSFRRALIYGYEYTLKIYIYNFC